MAAAVTSLCSRRCIWSAHCELHYSPNRQEGVHKKYSVNKQQVNECTGRTLLSNMPILYTQQLYPYNCGKFCTCESNSGVNSHSILLT